MSYLQRMGKSLMIPVAVMPAAAILLSFGAVDIGNPFIQQLANICEAGGKAIFEQMPLLFAIGIAIGFTDGAGSAALTAAVGYMVFVKVLATFEQVAADGAVEILDTNVIGGILTGLIAAYLYQRYKDIKLPQALGFFSGRRFVPILASAVMVAVGWLVGLIWLPVQHAIYEFGVWLVSLGGIGTFLYGFFNRLLIPTGLHHILNNLVWYNVGAYTEANGNVVHGDMLRFFAGDPTAGMYMTGFFPVMMFGLPGAAFAIILASKPGKRKYVMSIMVSGALASFLTGITEPIEFAFIVVAPILFVLHALMTGASMAIMYILHVKMGFGFSAGLIDFGLSWGRSTSPILIVLVGIIYFVIYYGVFTLAIHSMRLATPGREEMITQEKKTDRLPPDPTTDIQVKAASIVDKIGGIHNIRHVDACITRLRLSLRDDMLIDERGVVSLGAAGVIRLGKGMVHIVYGTDSELLKDEIKLLLPLKGDVVG